ncbi:MAG: hypothetical protein NT007_17065 [Candidatus Kapabacteria bacterium]|nr:hypothetical protein [Candidatus Kapabacteria bacterium]
MIKLLTVILACMAVTFVQAEDKFFGQTFFDYGYNVGRDAGFSSFKKTAAINGYGSQEANAYGFAFRRIQFTWDHIINESLSSRFRLETDGKATSNDGIFTNSSNTVQPGNLTTYIKDAYIKYTPINALEIQVGLITTLSYENAEANWGYRCIEKTFSDLRKLVGTRDLGMLVKYKFDDKANYIAGLEYGNGFDNYISAESNVFKRFSANFTAKPFDNFTTSIYYEQNWMDKNLDYKNIGYFAGYNLKGVFTLGAEFWYQMQAYGNTYKIDTINNNTEAKNQMGFSIFGNVIIIPELALVVRFDNFDPNTINTETKIKQSTGDSRNYIMGGLDWKITPNLSLIPNVQYETYQTWKDAAGKETTYKPSVNARFTVFYRF